MVLENSKNPTSKLNRWLEYHQIRIFNSELLSIAMTHPSYKGMVPNAVDYERLEFLGDSVLDLIAADYLYHFSAASEGILTEKRKLLVKNDKLAHIFDYLKMLPLVRTAINYSLSIKDKANFVESMFGAVYLEHGYEYCKEMWEKFQNKFGFETDFFAEDKKSNNNKILPVNNYGIDIKNAKSMLQELCQKRGFPIPTYAQLTSSGPDHKPTYKMEVTAELGSIGCDKTLIGVGLGSSKKIAELRAAENLCTQINMSFIPSE